MNGENLQTDLSVTTEINLYYDFYKPAAAEKPLPLVIAVHGYGAHKRRMMREARAIANDKFAVASLEAPHQHFRQTAAGNKVGFGWLTDHRSAEWVRVHHKFILDVIENLTRANAIDAARIFLFGFSQACALNFRFAFTHPQILRGVLGVCGAAPSDLATNPVYQPTAAEVFYLYGGRDEFYPAEKFANFDAQLRGYLPNYQSKSYDARHEITDEMRADMKIWLENQISENAV